ncbi:MAG: hypothetical protein JWM27_984 [Gemmatimonadetes bacterium]|nr:hypothetical protein [Gemmatimonadota bacterium]
MPHPATPHPQRPAVQTPPAGADPSPRRSWSKALLRGAVIAVVLAGLVLAGHQLGAYVPRFAAWVRGLGALGPVVFILGYAAAAVAFAPGSVLTLAAGAIFGLVLGTAYVFIGATLGAVCSFLVSRHVARSFVEQRLRGSERFAAVADAVGQSGRRIVFLMRLSPVFPYNLTNYALGLTRVRFVDYLVASLGMLPGTVLYVYYGKLAGDVAAAAGGAGAHRGTEYYVLLGLGLVATVAVTAVVTRIAKKALTRSTEQGSATKVEA